MAARGNFVFPIDATNHEVLVIWDVMAMTNMNLIGVIVTKLWPAQALACGDGCGTTIHNTQKFSNFGDIIMTPELHMFQVGPTTFFDVIGDILVMAKE